LTSGSIGQSNQHCQLKMRMRCVFHHSQWLLFDLPTVCVTRLEFVDKRFSIYHHQQTCRPSLPLQYDEEQITCMSSLAREPLVSACCMPYAADAIFGADCQAHIYFIIIPILLWRDKTTGLPVPGSSRARKQYKHNSHYFHHHSNDAFCHRLQSLVHQLLKCHLEMTRYAAQLTQQAQTPMRGPRLWSSMRLQHLEMM